MLKKSVQRIRFSFMLFGSAMGSIFVYKVVLFDKEQITNILLWMTKKWNP